MKIFKPLFILVALCVLSLSFKARAVDTHMFLSIEKMMAKYDQGTGLLALELDQAMNDHNKLTKFTRNYGSFLRNQIEKEIDLTGPQLNLIYVSMSSFILLTELIDEKLTLDLEEKQQGTHSAIWLYRKIKVTESFKTIYSLYFNEKKLRRIIRDQSQYNPYQLMYLDAMAEKILSKRTSKQVSRLLSELLSGPYQNDEVLRKLESTLSYQLFKQERSLEPIYSKETYWSDVFKLLSIETSRGFSWAFGASIGNVQWGPGALYKNRKMIIKIKGDLKPLDLVFEKKAYKLTDYTIPGYWGHVGIWLGSEKQLRELGLWHHPSLDTFREQIRNGNSIYEVRKWGLNFDNLESFSNLDEILISRVNGLKDQTLKEIAYIYENLANQIDKKYDFTFNALATDKTTCTEIIYLSYGNINWPSKVIFGRRTISPNNIAELIFYRDSPLKMIRYFGSDKETGRMIEKNLIDLAKTVEYAPATKRASDGSLQFNKIERDCRRVRIRKGGSIRFRYECENDYRPKYYSEGQIFNSQIFSP